MTTEFVFKINSFSIVLSETIKSFYKKNKFFIQNFNLQKVKGINIDYTNSFLEEGEIKLLSNNNNIDKIIKSIINSISTFKTNSKFIKIEQLKSKLIFDEKGTLINIIFYIRKNDLVKKINIKTKTVNSFKELLEKNKIEITIKGISSIQEKTIELEKEINNNIPYYNELKI